MSTTEIKRVFWKDAVVLKSYSIGSSSTINVLSFNPFSKPSAIFQNGFKAHKMEVIGKVATSLLSVQILRSIRSVSMSLAIASSCASDVLIPYALTTRCKSVRAITNILASALISGVQYSVEYAMFAKIQNNLKIDSFKTKNDFAVTFVAGCLATNASNMAVCLLRGRKSLFNNICINACAGGLGYATMDKTFEALYMPTKRNSTIIIPMPFIPQVTLSPNIIKCF
jgi:hypothetical protein